MAVDRWIDDVKSERGEDVIIVLCGNKSDLSEKREVSFEEGESKARDLDCIFMETSAKTGHNVKNLFTKIAQSLPGAEGAEMNDTTTTTQRSVKTIK